MPWRLARGAVAARHRRYVLSTAGPRRLGCYHRLSRHSSHGRSPRRPEPCLQGRELVHDRFTAPGLLPLSDDPRRLRRLRLRGRPVVRSRRRRRRPPPHFEPRTSISACPLAGRRVAGLLGPGRGPHRGLLHAGPRRTVRTPHAPRGRVTRRRLAPVRATDPLRQQRRTAFRQVVRALRRCRHRRRTCEATDGSGHEHLIRTGRRCRHRAQHDRHRALEALSRRTHRRSLDRCRRQRRVGATARARRQRCHAPLDRRQDLLRVGSRGHRQPLLVQPGGRRRPPPHSSRRLLRPAPRHRRQAHRLPRRRRSVSARTDNRRFEPHRDRLPQPEGQDEAQVRQRVEVPPGLLRAPRRTLRCGHRTWSDLHHGGLGGRRSAARRAGRRALPSCRVARRRAATGRRERPLGRGDTRGPRRQRRE